MCCWHMGQAEYEDLRTSYLLIDSDDSDLSDLEEEEGHFRRYTVSEFKEFYEIPSDAIGSGKFGLVNRYIRKSIHSYSHKDKIFAGKEVADRERAHAEVKALKTCSANDHIIQYYDHFFKSFGMNRFVILMELAYDNLENFVKSTTAYSTPIVFKLAAISMIKALTTVHAYGYIHRDVNPSNFLIKNGQPVLAGFGCVIRMKPGKLIADIVGECRTSAPEMLQYCFYDELVDIWSLGCTLYWIANKEYPFEGENGADITTSIHNSKYDWEPGTIGKDSMDIIKDCLRYYADDRKSASDFWVHPALTQYISAE